MPDGKPSQNRDWTLYYVELQGSQLTFWQPPQQMHHLAASLTDMGGIAFELEDRDETMRRIEFMKTRSKPAFINLTEGTTEWVGIFKKGKLTSYRGKLGSHIDRQELVGSSIGNFRRQFSWC